MGEEFAGPEKLGLVPKVLQNLWGSAEPFFNKLFSCFQMGMNGDTCSSKAPKECSKKFVATFKWKFFTRGNVFSICSFCS